jgi:Replication protein C C-terminal region
MVHGIRPDELPRLTPKLKPYLQRPNPAWPEIIDAADWLRHDLGVSKSLWGDARLAIGRELATVALAIVSTKEADHFQTSPGGYVHGMVTLKAKAGELYGSPEISVPEIRITPQTHGMGFAARRGARTASASGKGRGPLRP